MGTLSKRRLEEFGVDVKSHVARFRATAGQKPDKNEDVDEERAPREGPIQTAWQTWLAYAGVAVVLVGITSKLVRLAVARARE